MKAPTVNVKDLLDPELRPVLGAFELPSIECPRGSRPSGAPR